MRFKSKARIDRRTAAIAAAIAGIGFTAIAHATTYSTTAFEGAQIEPGEAYEDGGGEYFQLTGSAATYPTFGVLDFSAGSLGIAAGQQVTSVNPDLDLTMYYDSYSKNTDSPVTLTFYLATDTNPAEVASGATLLSWEPNSTVGGGLNAPGSTGSFAAGTSLYQLGTETYSPGGTSGTPLNYDFTLNSTEEQYIEGQINTGNTVRIVATTSETDQYEANFYGYEATTLGYAPQLAVDVNTQTVSSNTSKLYFGATGTSKSGSVNIGTSVNINGTPTLCVLQGGQTTTQVTLNNGSTTSGDNLTYSVQGNNASASNTSPGPDPIAPGGTAQVTVGFSGADTANEAGNSVGGSVTITNSSNYATDTTPVTVTLNPATVLQERFVDSPSGASALNVGKVLTGKTGTVEFANALSTTNPVNLTDYSDDALTTLTLSANVTSTPYTQYDYFTGNEAATISATSISTPQIFGGPNQAGTQTGSVFGNVAVVTSGIYGNDTPVVEGTLTQTYAPQYTAFGQTDITGDGLQGEKDSMDVYLQWQGYQIAAVTGNNSSPINVGGTVTLTNAATNDNIYVDANGISHNNGLRAAAWVTGVSFNQTWSSGGWSQTGFTFANGNTPGTILNGSQSVGDPNSYSASATTGFVASNQMINGTYSTSMTVNLENDQTIQGATANDVAPVTFVVQSAIVSGSAGNGSGAYTLNGGTLVAGATDLTGSFTQSGGQSTFANITGSGQLSITGGSATLAAGGGGSTVSSLSISGGGSLNISNNHLIISDPSGSIDSTIRGYLYSGYNGGGWNGPGIITSAPTSTQYGIGYADGADGGISGITSGQLEVKYTLYGDTNLDGAVNSIDFGNLAANFGKSNKVWDQGDFNYDGTVNSIDFGLLAGNFGKSVGGNADVTAADWAALDAFAAANGLTADVPEPASMGILAISGLAILSRRRRAQRC